MAVKPAPEAREERAIAIPLELRAAGAGTDIGTAEGYAALFNAWTDIGDSWREVILPGAFSKSLSERDVLAVHSHDTGRVVGRMNAGTLALREDNKGLHFTNDLPDTSDGRDLKVQIGRGDIAGMSFAFVAVRQEWDDTKKPPERRIVEAKLYEITYTAFPAYPDTEVGLRSLEHAKAEKRDHNRAGALARLAARRARQSQIERNI